MITYELLNECLNYDPETGIFRWKVRPLTHFKDERVFKLWNTRYSLKKAGALNRYTGYMGTTINGKNISLHRAAFIISYGYTPISVDHINGFKTDNRLCNLREATISQNNMNRGVQSNNSSGFKGLHKIKNGRWRARIHIGRKEIHLGYFVEKEDAINAFLEAEKKYHKEFSFSAGYRNTRKEAVHIIK